MLSCVAWRKALSREGELVLLEGRYELKALILVAMGHWGRLKHLTEERRVRGYDRMHLVLLLFREVPIAVRL